MKFEEAFDITFEKYRKRDELAGIKFTVNADTAKILAFAWNMIATAKNVLDDNVFIDENNNIVSFAKEQVGTDTKEPKQKKPTIKGKTAKSESKQDEVVNAETTATEPATN